MSPPDKAYGAVPSTLSLTSRVQQASINTCKLVRRRSKRQEKEKHGKAEDGKVIETENGTGIESDMDMAMTMSVESDMNRELESMTEGKSVKREEESKQVSRSEKEIM